MQIICKANPDIEKIWNVGKIRPAVYRPLTYLLPLKTDDGTLLHNAVTGELIFLNSEEAQKFSALPREYAPWMDELIQKHFLVRTEHDDKKTVDTLRKAWLLGDTPKEITGYTVLPTTNCNARCFYCYEANCRHENMTDETADKLVEFIKAHHGTKPVHISWFGGEPLVGIRQIDRICSALQDNGIAFSSYMISNGYLFDSETARRAKALWNLTHIQITLDGTEQVYNAAKAYVNPCESPYRRVLDNIGLLLKNDIPVIIRLNLGLHNADDLTVLVQELAERFTDRTKLSVYSHILFNDCGYAPTHFAADELALLHEKQEMLTQKLQALSLFSPREDLPRLQKHHCMADYPGSVAVVPSGNLIKCEHHVDGNPVGNLETGITDREEIKLYSERNLFSDCPACTFYPSCIMLKRCVDGQMCTQYDVSAKLENAMRSMRLSYEDFLRGNKKTTESGASPDCQKGKML